MPRRKTPPLSAGEFVVGDAFSAADLENSANAIQACDVTRRLPDAKRTKLKLKIVPAVARARGAVRYAIDECYCIDEDRCDPRYGPDGRMSHVIRGWGHWLRGKEEKPDARDLDTFAEDVMIAWLDAGVPVIVWKSITRKSGKSDFVSFIDDLGKATKIMKGRNSLINNCERAVKSARVLAHCKN